VTKAVSKGGRPTKFSTTVAGKILEAIKGGNYLEPSCRAAGVSYRTVRLWLKRGRRAGKGKFFQFFQDYLKAHAEAELETVSVWKSHLPESHQACRDLLARRYPKRWANREKREVELTGAKGGPVEIAAPIQEALACDETRELLAQLTERLCVLPAAAQPSAAGPPGHGGALAAPQAPGPAQPQADGFGYGPD
jgi:hypothetical protein